MQIAVIGLGSMGKRRIRLIKKYDPGCTIVGVDSNPQRRNDARQEYGIKIAESIVNAKEQYGVTAAFVSTSPLSHAEIIHECLSLGLDVFTELNLLKDGYEENIALAKQNNCRLFLSSTFLYREEIAFIKESVKNVSCKLCYNYHIGQYLPDWHPWESYKDFFISDKRTNGCREIFAIELPWLTDIFGGVKNIKVIKDRMTELNIDYNDCYNVLIEHESGHMGALCVDVISRKAVRNFELYGEELYISWNGAPDGLYKYDIENKRDENIMLYHEIDKLKGYSSSIIENAYFSEIQSFFEMIENGTQPRYSFEQDLHVLELIDAIEGANE